MPLPPGSHRTEEPPTACLDAAQLLDRVCDSRPILRDVAGVFSEECTRRIADLHAALAVRDASAVSEAAHALKGSAGNMAGTAASAAAGRVETLALAGDLDAARDVTAVLEIEITRLKEALAALLEEMPA